LRYHSLKQTPPSLKQTPPRLGPTNQPSLASRRRLSVGLYNGGGLRRHPPPHFLPQGYGRQGLVSTILPSYVHLCASLLSARRCRVN
jgi:hypothetical protein